MQRRASSVKSGRGFLLNDNTALAARKMQRRGTTDIEREPGLQKKPRRKAGPKSTFSLSRAQSRTCSGYAEARKRLLKTNEPFDEGERLRTVVGIAGQLRLHRGRGIFRPDRTVVGEKRRHPFDALVTLVVGRHEDFQRDMERRLLVGR